MHSAVMFNWGIVPPRCERLSVKPIGGVRLANSNKEEIHEAANALLHAINSPVHVNPTCRISKSKFMAGIKCLKREYLEVHHPELAAAADDGLLQQGIEVGRVAQGAFPGGVVVNRKNLSESVRITREVVANPEVPVICGSESHAGRATKMA